MAKAKTNKSQAVRDVLAANPEMKAKAVVAALAEKGITVTGNLVYFIKGRMKTTKGHKERRQIRQQKVAKVLKGGDPVALIRKIKALAEEVGGIGKLKELVNVLSE